MWTGGWQPKPDDRVEKAKAVSGEKLLRNIMLDNKIELYAPYVSSSFSSIEKIISPSHFSIIRSDRRKCAKQGKVMNCGGGGSCGTCIVEV